MVYNQPNFHLVLSLHPSSLGEEPPYFAYCFTNVRTPDWPDGSLRSQSNSTIVWPPTFFLRNQDLKTSKTQSYLREADVAIVDSEKRHQFHRPRPEILAVGGRRARSIGLWFRDFWGTKKRPELAPQAWARVTERCRHLGSGCCCSYS